MHFLLQGAITVLSLAYKSFHRKSTSQCSQLGAAGIGHPISEVPFRRKIPDLFLREGLENIASKTDLEEVMYRSKNVVGKREKIKKLKIFCTEEMGIESRRESNCITNFHFRSQCLLDFKVQYFYKPLNWPSLFKPKCPWPTNFHAPFHIQQFLIYHWIYALIWALISFQKELENWRSSCGLTMKMAKVEIVLKGLAIPCKPLKIVVVQKT